MNDTIKLTIDELAEQVGLPVRTVRFYISEGLIPGPEGRGKGTVYSEEQLLKLRLVRLLADRRVPLAEIRARLTSLSLSEVRALLGEETKREVDLRRAATTASPKEYLSGLLQQARTLRPDRSAPQAMSPASPPPPLPAPPRAALPAALAAAGPATPLTPQSAEAPAPAPTSMPSSQQWERWVLLPGVELHVRADLATRKQRWIQRLLAWVRDNVSQES